MANNFFNTQDEEEEIVAQPQVEAQPPSLRDQLYSNLIEKYGIDARNKVASDNAAPEGFNWRALGAGIGTSLQGKGAQGAQDFLKMQDQKSKDKMSEFDNQRNQLLKDYEFTGTVEQENKAKQLELEKKDPASERSKAAQQLLIQDFGFSPDLAAQMSAEQIEARIPTVKAKLDREFKSGEAQLDRDFKSGESALDRDFKAGESALDRELKKRGLDIKEKTAKSKSGDDKLTEGQKVADREFAKENDGWTSGGAKAAKLEINKLKSVAKRIQDGGVSTGMFTGLLPDRLTSNEVLSARSDVGSTIMASLRPILGAQFTEKEGERVIKNTWNEADSTENNLKRIQRLISDLEGRARDKDLKSEYFNEHGTLVGFRPDLEPIVGTQKDIARKQYSKSRNQTKITYEDGTEEIIDGRQ